MVVREPFATEALGALSFAEVQRRYLDDVFRYVSAFVRPPAEAEDVTITVFHAAHQSFSRLKRSDDPRVWLLGIARRKVADCLRKQYRRREDELSPTMVGQEVNVDQTVLLCQVLSAIPQDYGQVLVLKYVNGLSTEEIADLIGRSAAATNSLLQRARESFYAAGAPHFLVQEVER